MYKRRRRLASKYIFRRLLLTVLLLALVGGGVWFAYSKLAGQPAAEPAQAPVTTEPSSVVVPEPESKPEPEPVSVPESTPGITQAGASREDWELLLVNPTHPLPENYTMELETITDNYRVDARIADNVKLMFAQARENGILLVIYSAYRTVEKQEELFAAKEQEFIASGKDEQAAAAATAEIIARPGTSEHHTGLALDILSSTYDGMDAGFARTPAFKWLDENAHKFGFTMRYPEDKQDITKIIYEPWHYRYVGEHNATLMKEKGLCLEEYIDYLSSPAPEPAPESGEEEDQSSESGEADTAP